MNASLLCDGYYNGIPNRTVLDTTYMTVQINYSHFNQFIYIWLHVSFKTTLNYMN